jgi:hypothetical protein
LDPLKNKLYVRISQDRQNQNGINMVDLMMWLVIAALLLAAAIQGIGYYQKAAYLYHMKSDLYGAGENSIARLTDADTNGKLTKGIVEEGTLNTKWSKDVAYTVEEDPSANKPYIRATHPAVTDLDAIYIFESCGETFKSGANVVPKGSVPNLGTCAVTAPPVGGGGDPITPPVTDGALAGIDTDGDGISNATDPDIDGDGIPNGTDPDIDGDGIPNDTDTSPNGSGVLGEESTVPVSSKCAPMTVEAQVACWHDEFMAAQAAYESANDHYFGFAVYSNQPSYDFSPSEMAGTPLKYGATQETYRDSDPQYNYNSYESAIVDRDGYFWRGGYFNRPNGTGTGADTFGRDMNNHNINYACDFVTPADLDGLCTMVGIHQEKYVVASGTGDATAHADINKVLQAQLSTVQSTGELYGGYSQSTDVKDWAGTTYPTKVWNFPDSWGVNIYTRVMVTAPNGDLYTSQYRYWKGGPTMADAVRTYKYTDEMVDRVCSRPFTATYNQTSDIGTCTTLGYANFHP